MVTYVIRTLVHADVDETGRLAMIRGFNRAILEMSWAVRHSSRLAFDTGSGMVGGQNKKVTKMNFETFKISLAT